MIETQYEDVQVQAGDGFNTAVAVSGSMALINTVVPMVIYWAWIYRKSAVSESNLPNYRVAWRYYWISNLMVWFIPTILWACTLSDSKHVKFFLANWFKWLYGPQWGAFAATAVWFMNSIKDMDSELLIDPDTPSYEIWLVTLLFFAVNITNVVIVLVYEDDLAEWYPYNWEETNNPDTVESEFDW